MWNINGTDSWKIKISSTNLKVFFFSSINISPWIQHIFLHKKQQLHLFSSSIFFPMWSHIFKPILGYVLQNLFGYSFLCESGHVQNNFQAQTNFQLMHSSFTAYKCNMHFGQNNGKRIKSGIKQKVVVSFYSFFLFYIKFSIVIHVKDTK